MEIQTKIAARSKLSYSINWEINWLLLWLMNEKTWAQCIEKKSEIGSYLRYYSSDEQWKCRTLTSRSRIILEN